MTELNNLFICYMKSQGVKLLHLKVKHKCIQLLADYEKIRENLNLKDDTINEEQGFRDIHLFSCAHRIPSRR